MNVYVDFRGNPFAPYAARPAGDMTQPSGAGTQLGWGAALVLVGIGALVLFGDKWLKARGG